MLPNCRLAPESCWPGTPQDVARVWTWLQAEAAAHGGDPRRAVLAGESAGAAHVAAAALMRRFLPDGWASAGVALMSGPNHARLEGLAREGLPASPRPTRATRPASAPTPVPGAMPASSVTSTPRPCRCGSARPSATWCRCRCRPVNCSRAWSPGTISGPSCA
ncbi:MAG: alpha/beta hydrolase fold domain-containing protein [Burkholderiaceae bacterium]|nr:alpha/beta hydrolase fold domain-containing protein [Burkholderiaceae bacterium]